MYKPNGWSDHSSFSCVFGDLGVRKGGGLWVFNNSLLLDKTFVKKINDYLDYVLCAREYSVNVCLWWEDVKVQLKKKSIHYSKEKKWKESLAEKQLHIDLELEMHCLDSMDAISTVKYEQIQKQLEVLEINRCKGAAIRSKAVNIVDGEKCTAYFLGLEKRQQQRSEICQLVTASGSVVSKIEDILSQVQTYYRG